MKPNEIAGRRRALGLTQQQVADELDVTLASYRKKEQGLSRFTGEQKFDLARVLQFDFDQTNILFDGKLSIFLQNNLPK